MNPAPTIDHSSIHTHGPFLPRRPRGPVMNPVTCYQERTSRYIYRRFRPCIRIRMEKDGTDNDGTTRQEQWTHPPVPMRSMRTPGDKGGHRDDEQGQPKMHVNGSPYSQAGGYQRQR
jgi:hypothetical protein